MFFFLQKHKIINYKKKIYAFLLLYSTCISEILWYPSWFVLNTQIIISYNVILYIGINKTNSQSTVQYILYYFKHNIAYKYSEN